MKKIFFLTFLVCFSLATFAQTKHITRIGVINASPGSLNNILNLVEKNHIQADSIFIIGLLHKSQEKMIEASKEFIMQKNYTNIEMRVIQGNVDVDELFVKNDCTKEFRNIFENTDAIIRFGGNDNPTGNLRRRNIPDNRNSSKRE